MQITIPVTITYPGYVKSTPFGNVTVPGESQQVTVTVEIDQATAQALQSVLK